MVSKTFFSNRLKCNVTIIMICNNVDNNIVYFFDDLSYIVIEKDSTYHLNEDGLNRCLDLLDDPRFTYWCKTNEVKIINTNLQENYD